MAKIVADDRARQGPRGKSILYVLIASLALLAIALVGLLTWNSAQTPPGAVQATSQQNSGPSPNSGSASPGGNASPSVNPNPPK